MKMILTLVFVFNSDVNLYPVKIYDRPGECMKELQRLKEEFPYLNIDCVLVR